MSSKNLNAFIEATLIAAFAMVLSFIPDFLNWFNPSFGAIPLVLFSLRRGTRYGLLSGFIWGLLHFVLGKVYYLSLNQVFLEYILAFSVMGTAGFFSPSFKQLLQGKKYKQAVLMAYAASACAVCLRYAIHYLAGVIFWSDYAPKGMSATWYSFTVNGTAGALTLGLVWIVLAVLVPTNPSFFLAKK